MLKNSFKMEMWESLDDTERHATSRQQVSWIYCNFGVAVNMATAGPEEGDSLEEKEDLENYSQFIVIGGGISGLSAASHLSKNGFNDFKLLEARNRLGGRIATMQMGGWQYFIYIKVHIFNCLFKFEMNNM